MRVKELIAQLKTFNQDMPIKLASDAEWNIIYQDLHINTNNGIYVLFGTGERKSD